MAAIPLTTYANQQPQVGSQPQDWEPLSKTESFSQWLGLHPIKYRDIVSVTILQTDLGFLDPPVVTSWDKNNLKKYALYES